MVPSSTWSWSISTLIWRNTLTRLEDLCPFPWSRTSCGRHFKRYCIATSEESCIEIWNLLIYLSEMMKKPSRLLTLGWQGALACLLNPIHMRWSHSGTEPQRFCLAKRFTVRLLTFGHSVVCFMNWPTGSRCFMARAKSDNYSRYLRPWAPQSMLIGKEVRAYPKWSHPSQNGVSMETKTL